MITTILVILFSIFTTINANTTSCENGLNCQCSLTTLDDVKIDYVDNTGMEFIVDVSSWNGLKIVCKGTKKLEDFKYTSPSLEKSIKSLSIRSCVLSDKTSLEKFVNKLGIKDMITFSFQSFKANNGLLTKEHFKGISNVKELILSHNSLSNITSEFFVDFPELERVDLSHNNIKVLIDTFNATPSLKYLDLNDNVIYSLSSTLFHQLENLVYLDLGYNFINNIYESTFNKLISLKNLSLRGNRMEDLPKKLFRELKKLETIDMSYNTFFNVPENLFNESKNLRRVFFHNVKVDWHTLPNYLFSNFENLEEIHLNNNGFIKLPDSLFLNSTSLKYIYLQYNFLSHLHDTFFRGLKNLKVLKINNNLIKIIPKGIFKDLEKLKLLDLSMNYIESLRSGVFEGLTFLSGLNMENNLLKYIEPETLFPLENLNIAKFSNNLLDFRNETKQLSPFYFNKFLEELHLSNNSIHRFFTDWSIGYNLKFLNLSHNMISNLSTNIFYFPSNNTLVDLRFNNISNIWLIGIEVPAIYETKKRDVKILIENNPILCDCHLYDLIRYFNNELPTSIYNYVEIVTQNLTCIHTNGTMGPKIEQLNSTTYVCSDDTFFKKDTYCPIGCKCYIRMKDKTRIIDCSRKQMSDFVVDKEKPYLSYNYPVILDLSWNALTKMPPIEPLEPIILISLLLSNNRISEITIDKLPPTLQVLELHNNRILRIGYSVLKYLGPNKLHHLTLSGNPFICDCDVEALLVFVKLCRSTFKDLTKLKCEEMYSPLYNTELVDICPLVREVVKGDGVEKRKINVTGRIRFG
ncbi:hypothetical protein M0802_006395 [Mischocyttarus mexicanus]|nr:hypothetical protein M0802_006395 [Mischocyttarus mexicanus]